MLETINDYLDKYGEFVLSDKIDISKFDGNFFSIFIKNRKDFDNFYKDCLLPYYMEKIKERYSNVNVCSFSKDKLNAYFSAPSEDDSHVNEILINLRNIAICENIFTIMARNQEAKQFVFSVGNDHIEGLKEIINRCNIQTLKVEYYSKSSKDDINTKFPIRHIMPDSPILNKIHGVCEQICLNYLHVSVDSNVGPVCLSPIR